MHTSEHIFILSLDWHIQQLIEKHLKISIFMRMYAQGDHGTGKTGNLVFNFPD